MGPEASLDPTNSINQGQAPVSLTSAQRLAKLTSLVAQGAGGAFNFECTDANNKRWQVAIVSVGDQGFTIMASAQGTGFASSNQFFMVDAKGALASGHANAGNPGNARQSAVTLDIDKLLAAAPDKTKAAKPEAGTPVVIPPSVKKQ